jgi:hypothetical protein
MEALMKPQPVGTLLAAALILLLGQPGGVVAAPAASSALAAETPLLLGVGERITDLELPPFEGSKRIGYQYSYVNLFFFPVLTWGGKFVASQGPIQVELTPDQVRVLESQYGPLEDRVNWWVRFCHLFWFALALLLSAWWFQRDTRPSPQLERSMKVQRLLEQEAYQLAFLIYRAEVQKGNSEPAAFGQSVAYLSGLQIDSGQAAENLRLILDVMHGTPPQTAPPTQGDSRSWKELPAAPSTAALRESPVPEFGPLPTKPGTSGTGGATEAVSANPLPRPSDGNESPTEALTERAPS